MIKTSIKVYPLSFNCDFEKAVFSAIKSTWKDSFINGCWFHLSQAFLQHVKLDKKYGLYKAFENDRLVNAWPYLPPDDLIDGFNLIKENSQVQVIFNSSLELKISSISSSISF